jgi:hypothetical protein
MLKISLSKLFQGKALCGLASLIVACFAAASAAPTSGPTETGIANASQALVRYASSHSVADLNAAVLAMGGTVDVDSLTPANFMSRRRELVQAWATIIKVIEQSYDPSFDPKQGFSCPIPPSQPNGQLQPCTDPANISDPTARAQYETALANFRVQVAKARRHQQLVNIEGGAFSGLNMSLKLMSEVAPDGTSPDFAALDSILQQTGLASATRAKIDAMFYPGSKP